MAPTVTRLILSFALLVAAPVFFVIGLIVLAEWIDRSYQYQAAITAVMSITSVTVFAVGWALIWRAEVDWTNPRQIQTLAVFVLAWLPGTVGGGFVGLMVGYDEGAFVSVFGALGWLICWLFGTALVWKETAKERAARISALGLQGLPCPSCGYNLTGMRECKCPECGTAYTLDQLFAALDEQRRPLETTAS